MLNTDTMVNFKPSNSNGKGHYLKRKIQLRLAAVTRFKNGREPIECWICNLDQKFWDTSPYSLQIVLSLPHPLHPQYNVEFYAYN